MPIYPTKTVDYNFDNPACYNGSGTVVTDLQGNLDLNFVGTPTFTSSPGNGSYFAFDYTTAALNHLSSSPNALLNGSFDFSYSYCIKPIADPTINSVFGGIVSLGYDYTHMTLIGLTDPSALCWNIVGANQTFASPFNVGEWCVVTVTYDQTNNIMKAYINGTLATTLTPLTQNPVTFINPVIQLGHNTVQASQPASSDIKAFSVWKNVVLTAPQVQAVADGFIQFTNPPVMDLNASESTSYPGSGTTWSDLSAGNFDFTMSNPAFTAKTSSTPAYFTFPGRALTDPLTVYGEYNGTPAITTEPSWTDTVWVRIAANHLTYGQSRLSIFANGREDLSGPDNGWALGAMNGSPNSNIMIEASGYGVFFSGTNIPDDEWIMLSYVKSGSNISIYLNGTLLNTQAWNYNTPADGMWISRTAASLFSWIGDISIIRQFDIALTQPQIDEIYQYDLANYIAPNPPVPVYAGKVGGRQFAQGFNG